MKPARLKKTIVTVVAVSPLVFVFAQCADFSSGQCTDKALCDALEAGSDQTSQQGDTLIIDVSVDTIVKPPDGDVPDGECNGGAENCANGIDDNCDGLIDCADPLCKSAGYECVAPPQGWTGPVALSSITGGNFPGCTGAYATPVEQGHDGLAGSSAQCGCACGSPTNVQCNSVSVNYYSDDCVTADGNGGLPPNFCVNTGSASVTYAQGVASATAFNGNCAATPSKTVPPVTYANSYSACSYDGPADTGGCTSAQCVQTPASGKTCVYQAADVACPTTTYTVQTVLYTGDTDTRDCTTCTCTATAGTCSATINLYANVGCSAGYLGQVTTDNLCHPFSGVISAEAGNITTNPGTCGNNGTGGATGSVAATNPVTVCCTP